LVIRADAESQFLAFVRDADVLRLAAEASGGGMVSGALVREGASFVVLSVWRDESAIDAWMESSERVRVQAGLNPFLAQPPRVTRFPVLDEHP
jgi:quinol monooxygenase YgiN